jgi:cardiolipin synthase
MTNSAILSLVYLAIHIAFAIRIIIRPHRDPASRIAWLVVIVFAPVVGIIAYILLGEVNIGRSRVRRAKEILAQLPRVHDAPGSDAPAIRPTECEVYEHLYRATGSINGFAAHGGNSARLLKDSNAAITQMVEDIDNAKEHVHLLFYIWLTDNNGCKMADALKRAAARGVTCRAMADGLGSRDMIKSKVWKEMGEAGVRLAVALPIGNPIIRTLRGRVDLRNHRKILVIDNRVTFCGSQNCADPEFRVKPKYAPWVDAVMRFEGPVVRQNQFLFASDWMAQVPDDSIDDLLRQPLEGSPDGFTAMAFGTGPTNRYSAMPEVFENLMYTARHELVITTPYYVPTESMQAALCASARRGVKTTIVFPARNDSWIVAAASHSYYEELLDAGVRIREYSGGLLHTKSLTLDGDVTLIGSANMDRRSFELNYENNILLIDRATTAAMRERQDSYIASSKEITAEMVDGWPLRRRLLNNAVAMLGPVL